MREVVAVAAALGYGDYLSDDAVIFQMQRSKLRKWPGVAPSMMTDVLSAKSIEVEAVIGKVVKVAREKGVDVPRLETLYLLLKAYEFSTTQG
jgi:2-dehydropantoate 2-reductase